MSEYETRDPTKSVRLSLVPSTPLPHPVSNTETKTLASDALWPLCVCQKPLYPLEDHTLQGKSKCLDS